MPEVGGFRVFIFTEGSIDKLLRQAKRRWLWEALGFSNDRSSTSRTSECPARTEHFDVYRFATDLNERTAEGQVRLPLYRIGRQSREISATFNLSADDAKSFESIKKKFDDHFVMERNVVYESVCIC